MQGDYPLTGDPKRSNRKFKGWGFGRSYVHTQYDQQAVQQQSSCLGCLGHRADVVADVSVAKFVENSADKSGQLALEAGQHGCATGFH
jgi:hypothetical protein